MDQGLALLITGVLGLITGTAGFYYANKYLEQRKQDLSTKRDRFERVYAPLEILLKMNGREFERYNLPTTTIEDKEYIEKNVWYPNNRAIKQIIMDRSHLLMEIPEEFLKLLTHINVWLLEFELVYIKKVNDPPVFVGPKGYGYPKEVDRYLFGKADELRRQLNR
jgi:hypothetical protein